MSSELEVHMWLQLLQQHGRVRRNNKCDSRPVEKTSQSIVAIQERASQHKWLSGERVGVRR
jgi:hypothetical protein